MKKCRSAKWYGETTNGVICQNMMSRWYTNFCNWRECKFYTGKRVKDREELKNGTN